MKPIAVICLNTADFERWADDNPCKSAVIITSDTINKCAESEYSGVIIANPAALKRITMTQLNLLISRIRPGHRNDDKPL